MAQPQLVVKGDGTADAAKLIQVVAKTTYLVPQARAGEETFSHLKDLLHLAGHQRVKQRATLQEAALRNVVGPFKVWTDGCCGIAAENGKRGAMFVNINLGEAAVGWHQDKFTRADIVGSALPNITNFPISSPRRRAFFQFSHGACEFLARE